MIVTIVLLTACYIIGAWLLIDGFLEKQPCERQPASLYLLAFFGSPLWVPVAVFYLIIYELEN
jgi:hypothetical protein